MQKILPKILKLIPKDQPRATILNLDEIGRFDSIPFDPGIPALIVEPTKQSIERLVKVTFGYSETIVSVLLRNGDLMRKPLGSLVDDEVLAFYIPALRDMGSFDQFRDIIARLRAPEDGCPWDTKQTIRSLRKNLLEECYEALDVIDTGKYADLAEELGDLLLIIVMIANIGEEEGIFDLAEMVTSITKKMIRRHPHIFGDVQVNGVEEVFVNWDQIKKQERAEKKVDDNGLLDGVPKSSPALSQGQQLQDRAARVGFDWPNIGPVLEKIIEEANEVRNAEPGEALESEIGDLFFVLVNFARWKKIDAETALQRTNQKFRRRFSYIEERVKEEGLELTDKSLDELDAYWNEAKKIEGGS